eukprot:4212240-Pyramimonas_sp.AAC.1
MAFRVERNLRNYPNLGIHDSAPHKTVSDTVLLTSFKRLTIQKRTPPRQQSRRCPKLTPSGRRSVCDFVTNRMLQ